MHSSDFGAEECIRALYMALYNEQEDSVCLLLKAADDSHIDIWVKDYDSLLGTAISERHMGVLRLLLITGARLPVNCTHHWNYRRFLAEACESGDMKVLETLIGSGANINESFEYIGHASALSVAAYNGQTNAVRLLLDSGADPNLSSFMIAGRFGSPLAAACWHESGDAIVDLLLRAGANSNFELSYGSFSDAFPPLYTSSIPVPSRVC
ncbi:hypothetical protein N7481_001218 [Penicillium waksmanii]|uniref:uncharacterized protein n=1 Tax=Penicillium waksmanii TaxID=69791 RepID=UPI002546BF2B|nr:uncharacterized protein N7481_001218 [Penicillium waksmanii]KAJ6000809.1 hypothetical protein N7481_001218 [Penicillium waksmanii]